MLTKTNQDGNIIQQQVGVAPVNMVTEDSIQKDLSEQGTDNFIINGGFDFWQRSLSDTVPAGAPKFVADRWTTQIDGTGTVIVSRQAATPGSIPGEPPYFWRYNQTVAGSGQIYADLALQRIEDVRTTAGKYITLSFYAYADTARTVTVSFYQFFGSGGSAGVTVPGATFSLTTSWQKFSVTVRMPNVSGKTIGANSYSYVNIAGNSINTIQQYNLAQVMLNIGTKAAPFKRAGGTIGGELALCQRYYECGGVKDSTRSTYFYGLASDTSHLFFMIPYKTAKRSDPVFYVTGSPGYYNGGWQTISTPVQNVNTETAAREGYASITVNTVSSVTANVWYPMAVVWQADAEL